MSKFGIKNLWDIQSGSGSNLNSNNTFTGKNTFENTGDVVAIKRTDNQSFGIVFKKEDGDRVGYIGTSESDTNKATVWGATGLKLQTTNSPIEITPGTAALTYTSSNTAKDRREVLVRNDLYYIKKASSNAFNIPASSSNNGYQTAQFTISGLVRGALHEFYIVMTTSSVDIGYEVKIQANNLNYPNMSEIKTLSVSRWDNSNIDNLPTFQIGWVQYGNDKLRFRAKNLTDTQINFTGMRIYMRIPSKIADN